MVRRLTLVCVLLLSLPYSIQAESEFMRGDVNCDAFRDFQDIGDLARGLFTDEVLPCADAADLDDNGRLDIADLFESAWQYFSPAELPLPYGWCGADPTDDGLGCSTNMTCDLGGPIEGLSHEELLSFNRGREQFQRQFRLSEGLGPHYNATACASCHAHPKPGGAAGLYRNTYVVMVGTPHFHSPIDGLFSPFVPSYGPLDEARIRIPESTPEETVYVEQRNTPPLYGVGLFEFVTNETLLSQTDPNDDDGDGISGRFNTDGVGNIGRFGWKANRNNLESSARRAAFDLMGLSNHPVAGFDGIVNLSMSRQIGSYLDQPLDDNDGIPDPELTVEELSDLITFTRFLAPPRRGEVTPLENQGEWHFTDLGCVDCHLPVLDSTVGPLAAYTDLLLHDLGGELAGEIHFGNAQFTSLPPIGDPTLEWPLGLLTGHEWRTAPLWGISLHPPFLHDGRAETLQDAILMHGGEAQVSRDGFEALTPEQQESVIAFLESL